MNICHILWICSVSWYKLKAWKITFLVRDLREVIYLFASSVWMIRTSPEIVVYDLYEKTNYKDKWVIYVNCLSRFGLLWSVFHLHPSLQIYVIPLQFSICSFWLKKKLMITVVLPYCTYTYGKVHLFLT